MGQGHIHIYNTKIFKGHTNTSAKERERSRVFVCPFLLLYLFLLLFSLVVSLCSATWRTQFTYIVCLKAFLCSDRQGKHTGVQKQRESNEFFAVSHIKHTHHSERRSTHAETLPEENPQQHRSPKAPFGEGTVGSFLHPFA